MTIINKVKYLLTDVKAYWSAPAKGDYVAYKEYLMLSVGWLGMRLATVFGISFGVNDPFTAMTLHMTHKDLLLFGYICTAIGYALAPLNAYIIDNLRSKAGKYKVYIRLGIPAGILSLFALFFPYEKMGYMPMVISLFLIGQIQGYVQQWYNTGVSNLVYVISPNSKERVKIMMVSSLIHNFAPTLTGLFIPVLSDVFANGDLYNIKTYRMVYPAFIVIGVAMSMAAYFGVNERIVQPKAKAEGSSVGLIEALKAVSSNRLFWIKCTDSWNNFMEDSKNVLMQWLFYYGKAGSMTMFGIMDTLSYNSSMWAMLFSPWMIDKMGKRGFKLVKNISQVFITLGLALTYKKSIFFIGIFFFLNRFWETTEVIDRAIESDIRDYQQYLSGKRIDGAFGVVETYVGGAIGAVTNLFLPWVYKKNGFDGTDYSVLEVYNDNGIYNPNNVLYKLLDNLLKISLVGAIIDVFPWIFYNLSEAKQRSVSRIIRIRSAIEDKADGVVSDEVYCEACESVSAAFEYGNEPKAEKLTEGDKKQIRAESKKIKEHNLEIETSALVLEELNCYHTEFGEKLRELCESIVGFGEESFSEHKEELVLLACSLPDGISKEEKQKRSNAISLVRSIGKSRKKADESYAFAKSHVLLARTYDGIGDFIADYDEASTRLEEKRAAEKAETDKLAERRKAEAKLRNKKH